MTSLIRCWRVISDCVHPLGLGSGKVKLMHWHASSSVITAPNAGLNGPGYWSPTIQDANQYLMVTFEDKVFVTSIATQGGVDVDGTERFVTSFYVSTSDARYEWSIYTEDEQLKVCIPGHSFWRWFVVSPRTVRMREKDWQPWQWRGQRLIYFCFQIFQGNQDGSSAVKNSFKYPFETLYIRIQPQTWSTGIALRAEFYGCLKGMMLIDCYCCCCCCYYFMQLLLEML